MYAVSCLLCVTLGKHFVQCKPAFAVNMHSPVVHLHHAAVMTLLITIELNLTLSKIYGDDYFEPLVMEDAGVAVDN